jgi:hypothetical protein
MGNKICPECNIGILIQLATEGDDTCYCPICEKPITNCIARGCVGCNYWDSEHEECFPGDHQLTCPNFSKEVGWKG